MSLSRRECGSCKACCTVLGVPELDKPSDTPCSKLCSKGCAIYETRPQGCRDYECFWLVGGIGLKKEHRPNKSGIIFDASFADFHHDLVCKKAIDAGIPVVAAREVFPGASKSRKGRAAICLVAKSFLVVVFYHTLSSSDIWIEGPDELIHKLTEVIKLEQEGLERSAQRGEIAI